MSKISHFLTIFVFCIVVIVLLINIPVDKLNNRNDFIPEPIVRALKTAPAKKLSTESQERVVRLNSSTKAKLKKKHFKPISNSYQDWENIVTKSEVSWAEFVSMPLQPPRQKLYIKPSVLNSIIQCSSDSVVNASKVCNVSDMETL